jgi:hypothetical protein
MAFFRIFRICDADSPLSNTANKEHENKSQLLEIDHTMDSMHLEE